MVTAKEELARTYATELAAMAREVIEANRYFVLGTVGADGAPRVSPVFFNHHEHRSFYWVSSPDSRHSRNLSGDRRVNAVVFDSSVPPGERVGAVFLTGTAAEVPEQDLAAEIPRAFADSQAKGAKSFSVEELSGDGDLRLYRLDVETAEVHARGGHPQWGLGIDTRLPVSLTTAAERAAGAR